MNTADTQVVSAVQRLVGAYRSQLRFARAAELARGRQYLMAESVLCPNGVTPDGATELDLLARIATLQRKYAHAATYWERALKLEPGNEDYSQALVFARERERQRTFFLPIILASVVGLFGLTIVTVALFIAHHAR